MTPQTEFKPGEAWKLARAALKLKDYAEVERLCGYMLPSDARLTRDDLAKALSCDTSAKGNA